MGFVRRRILEYYYFALEYFLSLHYVFQAVIVLSSMLWVPFLIGSVVYIPIKIHHQINRNYIQPFTVYAAVGGAYIFIFVVVLLILFIFTTLALVGAPLFGFSADQILLNNAIKVICIIGSFFIVFSCLKGR